LLGGLGTSVVAGELAVGRAVVAAVLGALVLMLAEIVADRGEEGFTVESHWGGLGGGVGGWRISEPLVAVLAGLLLSGLLVLTVLGTGAPAEPPSGAHEDSTNAAGSASPDDTVPDSRNGGSRPAASQVPETRPTGTPPGGLASGASSTPASQGSPVQPPPAPAGATDQPGGGGI
ncbi:MAG: hypothetical protein MI919_27640, partial [Holophagales bacterium]|nr:hypothetical protein [Holophagales bacterium]